MTHEEKKKTNWRPRPAIEETEGHETWSHTGPHEINDGVVDADVSLDYDEDEFDDE